MKNDKKELRHATIMAVVLALLSAMLLIASFIVPPTGIIDGSVLAGVGELFGFAALFKGGEAIDRGLDAKITHGNTTIDLNNPDKGD